MSDEKNPIVFFDSGVGGLSVLHQALKVMPNEAYIYYADITNVPYGNKELETIRSLVFEAMVSIAAYNPKAVVIACNTATSAAVEDLRGKYDFPIVGMEPAVKPALSRSDDRKVMVFATQRTLQEKKYTSLVSSLEGHEKVDCRAMMPLVDYAEDFDFDSKQLVDYLNFAFHEIDWDMYHTVVLGCTHFIYFRKIISEILPDHISIVDGNSGTINHLMSLISLTSVNGRQRVQVFLSGQEADEELIMPFFKVLNSVRG